MSSSHDAPHGAATAHAAHDHGDHGFDDTPASELGPGEPRTASWVPAVGLALFLGAAVYALASAADEGKLGAAAAPAPSAVAPAATPAMPALRPVQPPGGVQPPAGASGRPLPERSPEQLAEIRRRVIEAQQKRGQAGATGAPAVPAAPAPPAPAH